MTKTAVTPGQSNGSKTTAKSAAVTPERAGPKVVSKADYEKELARLQTELVRMQEWIVHEGLRVMVIFEGGDTAGRGGTIKRIMERLNARYCRGKLIARADDNPEALAVRLSEYHEQTRPLIAIFARKEYVATIDATQAADDVQAAIRERFALPTRAA